VEDLNLTALLLGEAKRRFNLLSLVAFPGHVDNGNTPGELVDG
jgi:hypothetical protein